MVTQKTEHRGPTAHEGMKMPQPAEMIQEYPLSSMLVIFGLGVGIGLAVTQAMFSSVWHEPTVTERLQRQIYDAFNSVVPEQLSRRFSA